MNVHSMMDIDTILEDTPQCKIDDIPIHNMNNIIKYLIGMNSQLKLSIKEKIHKLSSEHWKIAKQRILDYFADGLRHIPEYENLSLSEIRDKLEQTRNKKGRPPKKNNPWVFG